MKISNRGLDLIKRYEGCSLTAYKCPSGVLTIGYGHTAGVKAGDVITQEQADQYLRNDVQDAEGSVNALITSDINQHQFDALVSFTYNLGAAALQRSTLRRYVNSVPNDQHIRDEFGKWIYGDGRALEGLRRRRAAEADLYFTPVE